MRFVYAGIRPATMEARPVVLNSAYVCREHSRQSCRSSFGWFEQIPQPGAVISPVIHRVCIQCNNMFRVTPDRFDAKQCPICHKG